MTLKHLAALGIAGLVIGGVQPVCASEVVDPLAGAKALDEAQMGGARSGRSSRHWARDSVPSEPKPSKIGKIPFPEFNDLHERRGFDGVRLPMSGESSMPDSEGTM